MSEYNQAEIENIFIKTYETPPAAEPILEKPKKPKRKLTDKQKEALAKGRARAKERREESKLKSSQELKKEQRDLKKELKKEQDDTKSKIKEDKESKILADWETKKQQALGSLQCVDSYNTMKSYLDTLNRDDILNKNKLKGKLAYMVKHLQNREKKST